MKHSEKKNILLRFYRSLNFRGFKTIGEEKKEELDALVSKWYSTFHPNNISKLDNAVLICAKLIEYPPTYGLLTGDEIAYFYIQMLDPNLFALECYEAGNTKKEIKSLLMANFGYCDNKLIALEIYYNNHFHLLKNDDIWALERIKKDN